MRGKFSELIGGDVPVLVDFHAEWCGPCKAQSPIIREVSQVLDGRARVIKIDIDKNPALAERYQVRAVPTLALFRKGELIWRHAGLLSKKQILDQLSQQLDQ